MNIRTFFKNLYRGVTGNPFDIYSSVFSHGINYTPQESPVYVDQHIAMASTTIQGIVRRIAMDIAVMPRQLYRNQDVITDHQVHRLLNVSPNPYMTPMDYFETTLTHLLLWGDAYSYINWQGTQIVGIYPLLPWLMQVVVEQNGMDLVYVYNGKRAGPEQMLHFHGLSFNGVQGRSVIDDCCQTIGTELAQNKFASKYFKNGMLIDKYLSAPGNLNKDQRRELADSMAQYQGIENCYKLPILDKGMAIENKQLLIDQAQFCASRKYQMQDICRMFNIHPSKIGDTSTAMRYNNLELVNQDHINSCLLPWIVKLEQECERKLLLEREKINYNIRLNVEYMLRGDSTTRVNRQYKGLQCGIYSLNDVMREEGRPLLDPEIGDVRLSPLNLAPIGQNKDVEEEELIDVEQQEGEPVEIPIPQEEVPQQENELHQYIAKRLHTKEIKKLQRLWKAFPLRDAFLDKANEFYDMHRALVEKEYGDTHVADEHMEHAINNLIQAIENNQINEYLTLEAE
jgi:HK97 family phage portal protein